MSVRRLVLRSFQSPGDVLMLTAAVRDLHAAHPGKFQTDVHTSAPALWDNNPYLTPLDERDADVERIDMHYPLIHESDRRPYHFIHGYVQFLEERLGVKIPVTRFAGDIHLSADERRAPWPLAALGHEGPFWIVMAGGKYDFTAKWWNPASFQAVVDHFAESSRHTPCAVRRVQFVQCGEAGHFHPPLEGVINLVGKTSLREFIMLMHHAAGVLCPVTFAMHLAAAVPARRDKEQGIGNSSAGNRVGGSALSHAQLRPCVVIAGGREPPHWEQYPGHQFLHTIGALDCCATGGCWRSRCQPAGDSDAKDRHHLCQRPVQVSPELRIAHCMEMIEPRDVIRAIELFIAEEDGLPSPSRRTLDGLGRPSSASALAPSTTICSNLNQENAMTTTLLNSTAKPASTAEPQPFILVLIDFRHGLGDAVQLTTVLLHLRHYHPDWQIDVAAGVGKLPIRSKHGAIAHPSSFIPHPSLYHRLLVRDRERIDRGAYQHVFELAWDECPTSYADSPSTKAEYCLRSVFKLEPIRDLCHYKLPIGPDALAAARSYLESICGPGTGGGKRLQPTGNGPRTTDNNRYPAVLLHYQANTSTEKKNLSHELARKVCEKVLDAGYVPVILDWDKRSPLPDGVRVFNPRADLPLWGGTGTGDCEALAALIAQSSLMVGVDSGPLHVAGAVSVGNALRGDPSAASDNLQFAIYNSRLAIPTPTIAVWTAHHPLHYFGLADHVTHLVPEDHASRLRGDRSIGAAFFDKHYRYRSYRQLDDALPALVQERLTAGDDDLMRTHEFWVRRDNVEQDLVIVRDIAEQDSYRIAELEVDGPVAVDVGAHIGVFSRAFKRRHPSARVVAVECCPENIPALARNIGDFATIVPAALTYEREVALLNAVYPGCVSTGGSTVISRDELEKMIGKPGGRSQEVERPETALRDASGGVRPTVSLVPTQPLSSAPMPYWLDGRSLPTVTIEQLMAEHQLDRIDVLKLDCEGSEFSILENTTSLASIGAIVGEYHGRERFLELVARRFRGWQLRILRDEDPGTFWLINPATVVSRQRHRVPNDSRRNWEDGLPSPSRNAGNGLGRPSSDSEMQIDLARGIALDARPSSGQPYDDAYFQGPEKGDWKRCQEPIARIRRQNLG